MRAVLQRVRQASVTIDGTVHSSIGPGLLVFLGIEACDDAIDVEWLTRKITAMRIMDDGEGKMNLSLAETDGDVLVVSQFTLHASTKKGNRPSFIRSAPPAHSEPLYEAFCREISSAIGKPAATGKFGANMQVALIHDGPVTITIDSRAKE